MDPSISSSIPGMVGKMTVNLLSKMNVGMSSSLISYHETVPRRFVVNKRPSVIGIFDVDTGKELLRIDRNTSSALSFLSSVSFLKWNEETILVFGRNTEYFLFSVISGKLINKWSVENRGSSFRALKISDDSFIVVREENTSFYQLTDEKLVLLGETKDVIGDLYTGVAASVVFPYCVYFNYDTVSDGRAKLLETKTMKVRKTLVCNDSYTVSCTKNSKDEEIVLLGAQNSLLLFNCGKTMGVDNEEISCLWKVEHSGGWGSASVFGSLLVGFSSQGYFTVFDFSLFLEAKITRIFDEIRTKKHEAGAFYRSKEKFHAGDVTDMCAMTWNGKIRAGESGGVELLSVATGDFSVLRVSVGGLPFIHDEREEMARMDLVERVLFLREEVELFEGDKFGVFVTVKLRYSEEIEHVMRILL